MNGSRAHVPGQGPLTYGRVVAEATGMFREHFWSVALVAPTDGLGEALKPSWAAPDQSFRENHAHGDRP